MKYRTLGANGPSVSLICLGTMTWGRQNSEADGHAQMDYAVERGINFFDTAETYAVPPNAETYGKTETIIGTWFAKRKNVMALLRETIFQQESPLVDTDAANKATDADAALQELGKPGSEKAKTILLLLSDPTEKPVQEAGAKSACGAWAGF